MFSLEMSKDSLLTRMICASAPDRPAEVPRRLSESGRAAQASDGLGRLVEAPLFIDDTAGTNLMDVHAKLRKLKGRARTRAGDHRLPPADELRAAERKIAIRKSAPSPAA